MAVPASVVYCFMFSCNCRLGSNAYSISVRSGTMMCASPFTPTRRGRACAVREASFPIRVTNSRVVCTLFSRNFTLLLACSISSLLIPSCAAYALSCLLRLSCFDRKSLIEILFRFRVAGSKGNNTNHAAPLTHRGCQSRQHCLFQARRWNVLLEWCSNDAQLQL